MAVVSTLVGTSLKLTMKTGVDKHGKDQFASKTMNNLKVTATDADVFAIGLAMSNLKTYPLFGLDRVDTNSLVSDGK